MMEHVVLLVSSLGFAYLGWTVGAVVLGLAFCWMTYVEYTYDDADTGTT